MFLRAPIWVIVQFFAMIVVSSVSHRTLSIWKLLPSLIIIVFGPLVCSA